MLEPYYKNDYVTLYCGDCLEIMQQLNIKFDLIVCDLPYGTTRLEWDKCLPLDELMKQYNAITKSTGSLVLFGSEPFATKLRIANFENYKYDWIWQKNINTGFQHAKNMPLKNYENILVFSKGVINHPTVTKRRMTYNPQGVIKVNKISKPGKNKWHHQKTRPSHKQEYLTEYENYPNMILNFGLDKGKLHPTQKPLALTEYLINTYSNEKEIVLDNCAGSGTTGVACINLNRKCVLIEKDKQFCDVIVERLTKAYNDKMEMLF
jgi:site-specific DNA-methyltransferase (adenine-specific)